MSDRPKIAYYAPIKPPDHPIPSGDRQMARMLMHALRMAGYSVFLASRLISYSKRHQAEHMAARRKAAKDEAIRLIGEWEKTGEKPDLWFCYHPYDKAPDWLGMEICSRLDIPMITAEACRTAQGPSGEWLPWRSEAQRGLEMAAANLVMKQSDMDYLSQFIEPDRLFAFPPFIAGSLLESDPRTANPWPESRDVVRLLAVGMMRPGAKFESYAMLADALSRLSGHHGDWSLAVIGDGPLRGDVEALFAGFDETQVRFAGEKPPEQVQALMGMADLLTWPGCREAYGMVYLESANWSLPSLALRTLGVPSVVEHERTGLLADPPDREHYAEILDRAIGDPELRASLGRGAKAFVDGERSGAAAAERLRAVIDAVLEARHA